MKKDHLASRFIQEFSDWVSSQADIQAAALAGSYARNDATPESDIDFVLVTDNPAKYLDNVDWAEKFGEIDRRQREDYGLVQSLRVWYGSGLEVEFGITDPRWTAVPLDKGTREVMRGGIRVLFERREILSRHLGQFS
jgi:predicted nucleotidyltransferase